MNTYIFPRLFVLIGAFFSELGWFKVRRLKCSLSFVPPARSSVALHQFWQPIKEARGWKGKFVSLFFRTQDWDTLNKISFAALCSGAIIAGASVVAGIYACFVNDLFLLYCCEGLFLVGLTLLVLFWAIQDGRWDYVQWKHTKYKSAAHLFASIKIPAFAYQRVNDVANRVKEQGGEATFTYAETKDDPIIKAHIRFDGDWHTIPVAVFDKGCEIPLCQ